MFSQMTIDKPAPSLEQ